MRTPPAATTCLGVSSSAAPASAEPRLGGFRSAVNFLNPTTSHRAGSAIGKMRSRRGRSPETTAPPEPLHRLRVRPPRRPSTRRQPLSLRGAKPTSRPRPPPDPPRPVRQRPRLHPATRRRPSRTSCPRRRRSGRDWRADGPNMRWRSPSRCTWTSERSRTPGWRYVSAVRGGGRRPQGRSRRRRLCRRSTP